MSKIPEPISSRDSEEFNSQFVKEHSKSEDMLKDPSEKCFATFGDVFKPGPLGKLQEALKEATEELLKLRGNK